MHARNAYNIVSNMFQRIDYGLLFAVCFEEYNFQGGVRQFLEFPGGRGDPASSLKWKSEGVGGPI